MNAGIFVQSETNTLEKIIIHKPDIGISRMSPRRAEELLFDDIVFYPKLIEEYATYEAVLHHFCGKENVLYTEQLILESMAHNPIKREKLVHEVGEFEELSDSRIDVLLGLPDEELTEVLIHGYLESEDFVIFDPIPNFIFTRDIAVSIDRHILLTKAAKKARQRENLLTQFIFNTHPLFELTRSERHIIDMNDTNLFPRSSKGEHVSIEGGDVMIIDKDHLLIGVSERSSDHAIESLSNYLLSNNIIKNVVTCLIPAVRSFMHIDTIFTLISNDMGVAFAPLILQGLKAPVQSTNKSGKIDYYPNLKTFLKERINSKIEIAACAEGKSPYQEREQWTDACNLLALKNGVALAYDRNPRTAKTLEGYGYKIMPAQEFLHINDPHGLEKTIISLPSAELSRARGGSHCMSLPIRRSL